MLKWDAEKRRLRTLTGTDAIRVQRLMGRVAPAAVRPPERPINLCRRSSASHMFLLSSTQCLNHS